jgi:glyoxylate reductase
MGDRPRVVITNRLPGVSPVRIGEVASADWPHGDGPMLREEFLRRIPGAAGILCTLGDRIDLEVMENAGPALRVVSVFAMGTDNIDIPEATRRGIRICNTSGVLTEATADLAFALMLAAARRFSEAERCLREGKFIGWDPWGFLGVPVFRRTLGIVGMGRIGSAVAERSRGFEMRVLYHNRERLPSSRERELRSEYRGLEDLLAESDFVVLCVPLTEKTRGMIGRERLHRMKPEAVLVNVSRGEVVDEAGLADALEEGRIFAAGCDVYEKEPAIHPRLLAARSAVLLPHVGSATRETRERMGRLAAENLLAVLTGEEPKSPVN